MCIKNVFSSNIDHSLRGHVQLIWNKTALTGADIFLKTTFLAHSAYFMTDAIIRTLYRMTISRQHLLEWKTSAATKSMSNSLRFYVFYNGTSITYWCSCPNAPSFLIVLQALLLCLLG